MNVFCSIFYPGWNIHILIERGKKEVNCILNTFALIVVMQPSLYKLPGTNLGCHKKFTKTVKGSLYPHFE